MCRPSRHVRQNYVNANISIYTPDSESEDHARNNNIRLANNLLRDIKQSVPMIGKRDI